MNSDSSSNFSSIFLIGFLILIVIACTQKFNESSSNKKKYRNKLSSISNSEKPIEVQCQDGQDSCLNSIADRVVTVFTENGYGTGFILEADEDFILVITASHVIRKGNGFNSRILNTHVYNEKISSRGLLPHSACAFFKKSFGDVALIRVPNQNGIVFPQIKNSFLDRFYDSVFVVEKSSQEKKFWTYRFRGYDRSRPLAYLGHDIERGASGSPVFTKDGRMMGIISAATDYWPPARKYLSTIVSTQLQYNTLDHFNFLYSSWIDYYNSDYICRDFKS